MEISVKVKFLHPNAKIPVYSTQGSAGFDIFAIEDFSISPGEVKKIPTGLSMEIPSGHCIQIWDRSGKASKGIHHVGGIIDSDYRGEISLLLYNTTKDIHKIMKGDRIVQCLLVPIQTAIFELVDELSQTKRGNGGFHSTGN